MAVLAEPTSTMPPRQLRQAGIGFLPQSPSFRAARCLCAYPVPHPIPAHPNQVLPSSYHQGAGSPMELGCCWKLHLERCGARKADRRTSVGSHSQTDRSLPEGSHMPYVSAHLTGLRHSQMLSQSCPRGPQAGRAFTAAVTVWKGFLLNT